MSLLEKPEPKPWLFCYSLVLPAAWFSIGAFFALVVPGFRAGLSGSVVIFGGVVIAVSWLFVRRHRRQLARAERFRLVGYCAAWCGLLESGALLYAAAARIVDPSRVGLLVFAAVFSFAIDGILFWVGFTFASRRFIAGYLARHPGETGGDRIS